MRVNKYNNAKATVCANKTCVIVYGEVAKMINAIALIAVTIVAIALIAKAIR